MILITGATGNVGGAAARILAAQGAAVRAVVRDPEKAGSRLGSGVELVVGDFADPASLRRAMESVRAVLLSSADGPEKVAHETALIEAAEGAGVELIVKVSTLLAAPGAEVPTFDWHGRIEQRLSASRVGHVILRSAFYMSNLLMAAESVRMTGRLFAPAGGAAIAMIDPRDVGEVAAALLLGGTHRAEVLDLTGPEALTYEGVAVGLSEATGGSVQFVAVPDDAARLALVAAGLPDWLVTQLDLLFPLLRSGAMSATTDTVLRVTGGSPRAFRQFATDHAALFTTKEELSHVNA
jgi:uncharacterized protein YbjT (DUF2867 family)